MEVVTALISLEYSSFNVVFCLQEADPALQLLLGGDEVFLAAMFSKHNIETHGLTVTWYLK